MTLDDIKTLIVAVDPEARHYHSDKRNAPAYTVWREVERLDITADDRHGDEAWAFQVDRFTKAEGDAIAAALFAALDADDRVAVAHLVDFEADTGYIHHIFDCEGY